MAGQQKGREDPSSFQATDDLLFERGWIKKLRFSYLADEIMEAPKVLIEAIERGQEAQDSDYYTDPLGLFGGRDLSNEKKNHPITNQLEKEIPADCVVNGIKGIKDGQNKKDHKGKGESNLPDLQSPLCYPSIKPKKEGPG